MLHTTISSILRPLLVALTITFFFAACKPGETGPAGPTGNANVTQVAYNTAFTPSGSPKTLTLPAGIDKSMIDRSVVMVYIQTSLYPTIWYQIPGVVSLDDFRYYVNTSTSASQSVSIVRVSGTSIPAINAVRVLIIPAETVTNGRKAAVDYANYEAVRAYYNLPD